MKLNFFNRKAEGNMPALPVLPPLPGKEQGEYDPSGGSMIHHIKSQVAKQKAKSAKKKTSKKQKLHPKRQKKTTNKKIKTKNKKSIKKKELIKNKFVSKSLKAKKKTSVFSKKKSKILSKKKIPSLSSKNPKILLSKEKRKSEKTSAVKEVLYSGKGNILEKYELEVDGAHVRTEIQRNEDGITYNLFIPEVSPVTSAFLDEIRNELITATTVSTKELTDPSLFSKIKKRFMDDARRLLKEKLPHTAKDIEDSLVGTLMQEMLGLGKIEFLIADPNLEEIVIPSAKEPIRVYYKKYGWLLTNIKVGREEEIVNYSNIIARRVGRQITVLTPLLDAHLVTGDRINAVLYPVNTKGNTITIRKFARDPFTMIDMINNKTCDLEIAALLWLAIEYEMNVLISGGTGSGKTSFLNACMPFIPPNQRIISIEDTRELMLPDFLYWTPLVTRTPNPEGKGEVSMLDLLINSLRMRPDRIVLGEMRKEKEAMVLFEAMHTGHSVYSTVHADSAPETISRLVNPPLNVPPNLLRSVNLNVVMFRDRRKNLRRVLQVAEFEAEGAGARANLLYRWVADRDEIVRHSESSRFFEDLTRNTGMTQAEINSNLKEKKDIFTWLIKNNIRGLEEIGRITNLYYRNRELLLKAISQNNKNLIFQKTVKKPENEINISNEEEDLQKETEIKKEKVPQIQKKEEKTEKPAAKLPAEKNLENKDNKKISIWK
jgi:flagellar protein FlaI